MLKYIPAQAPNLETRSILRDFRCGNTWALMPIISSQAISVSIHRIQVMPRAANNIRASDIFALHRIIKSPKLTQKPALVTEKIDFRFHIVFLKYAKIQINCTITNFETINCKNCTCFTVSPKTQTCFCQHIEMKRALTRSQLVGFNREQRKINSSRRKCNLQLTESSLD